MNPTRSQVGRQFENEVGHLIKKTNYKVIDEYEIVRKYSNLAFGTDHLIYLPNKLIFFQHKWRATKPGLSDANHFINSVNYISEKHKGKEIMALYVKKSEPTSVMIKRFDEENSKGKMFLEYLYYGEQDDDFEPILNQIHGELHQQGIFLYDCDGLTIMTK